VIYIRKQSPLSFELLDNIDREAPQPINHFRLNITLYELVPNLRVCYIETYTEGIFQIKSLENKRGLRGRGITRNRVTRKDHEGNKGRLMPHKIQRGLFATTSLYCSDIVKSSMFLSSAV